MLADVAGRRRPDADHQRLPAGAQGGGAGRRRPAAHHGQPRLARRRDVRAPQRRRRSRCARSLDGHRRRRRAPAWRRSRSTWSSAAASTRTASCRWRASRGSAATSCASSSTWTSATPTAGGWTTSCPAAEILAMIDAEMPLVAVPPQLPGRGRRRAGATATARRGRASSRRSPSRSAPTCTRARLTAEGQLYTCLFGMRGHDLRAPLRAGADDDEMRRLIGGTWARTHRPLLGAPHVRRRRPLAKVEMSHIGG